MPQLVKVGGMIGAKSRSPGYPGYNQDFDSATADYTTAYDFSFGTGTHPNGSTPIEDTTDLAQYFDPYAANAGTAVLNGAVQRYMPFSSAENFVFTADGLELTATLQGTPPNYSTVTIQSASGTSVVVDDASAIVVGQMVSLGPDQDDNQHITQAYGIRGTLGIGNTLTVTIFCNLPASDPLFFNTITLTQTIDGSSTYTNLAQWFVDQINGNAQLAAVGMKALKQPVDPSGYAIVWPRYRSPYTGDYGRTAIGSVTWTTVVVSKTGSVLHTNRQAINMTYVFAKSGNTLTLNHPVTASMGDPLYVLPTTLKQRSNIFTGSGSTVIPVGDTSGLEVGQALQLAFQDSNLRRIVSLDASNITVESSVGVDNGNYVTSLPAYIAITSAGTTNGSVLQFTTLPASVKIGMQFVNADTLPVFTNITVTAIDRVSSPKTVTLSENVTLGSGTKIMFWTAVQSAQIWAQWGIMPGQSSDRQFVAMELTCETPPAAALAAWPAFWVYRNPDQPTGQPGTPGYSGLEIDWIEQFNYWCLNSFNCFQPGFGTPTAGIYNIPTAFVNGVLLGNNVGLPDTERKIQVVWGLDKVYWYFNGVLFLVRNFIWNRAYLAETGINLATGNISQNSNGFFPLDLSQFPMKLRVKRLRVLTRA